LKFNQLFSKNASFILVILILMIDSEALSDSETTFSDDILEDCLLNLRFHDEAPPNLRAAPTLLETINSRPLFVESRRPNGQQDGSETSTLLIDGSYKTVELVGTIDSTSNQIAAFALGGESTVWLQRNEHLGDWRIEEITPNRVRLNNEEKTRVLRMRKKRSIEDQQVEG